MDVIKAIDEQFTETMNSREPEENDEEIKQILSEINRLSNLSLSDGKNVFDEDVKKMDDVEQILEKAQSIAEQSKENYEKVLHGHKTATAQIKLAALQSMALKTNKKTPLAKNRKNLDTVKSPPKVAVNRIPSKINLKKLTLPKANDTKTKMKSNSAGVLNKDKTKSSKEDVSIKYKTRSKSAELVPNEMRPQSNDIILNIKENKTEYTNELIDSIGLENAFLKDQMNKLKDEVGSYKQENETLKAKVDDHEAFIMKLGREYDRCKAIIVSMKDREEAILKQLNSERCEKDKCMAIVEENKTLIDSLKRQCSELDMALKKKHPDSVSALIVASKTNHLKDKKHSVLEERIQTLEAELFQKENHFKTVLQSLHAKFGEIKQKYESHILDIEKQHIDDRNKITELRCKVSQDDHIDVSVDATPILETRSTQTMLRNSKSAPSVSKTQNSTLLLSKLKEDSYLVATIRGLQNEMEVKERKLLKFVKENEDLKKAINCLRREKEVLLNVNSSTSSLRSVAKPIKSHNTTSCSKSTTELEAEINLLRTEKEEITYERDTLVRYIRSNLSNKDYTCL